MYWSVVWHSSFLNYPSIILAVRVEHLSDAARSNQHALNKSQEEIGEYRRQLQSRTIELETLHGTKESLERQRVEYEERNHDELNSLQVENQHNPPVIHRRNCTSHMHDTWAARHFVGNDQSAGPRAENYQMGNG